MKNNKALTFLGYGMGLALLLRKDHKTLSLAEPDLRLRERQNGGSQAPARGTAAEQLDPAASKPKGPAGYIKRTFQLFSDDDCMTLAAAIAYYTVFALPPLLLLLIAIAGLAFGRAAVQHELQQQIQGLVGEGAGGEVATMVKSAGQSPTSGIIGAIVGIVALIFGATGAMAALQEALNKTWHVKPDPKAGGVKAFIVKRVFSLGMILGIGFLLMVSLAVSAALAAFGHWIAALLPAFFSGGLSQAIGAVFSFAVITVLFAPMFKFLPDAEVPWREVWVLYSGAASAYDAAGSVMLIVLWLYYASIILLLGAEFTKLWSSAHGHPIQPEAGAVRVVTQEKEVR